MSSNPYTTSPLPTTATPGNPGCCYALLCRLFCCFLQSKATSIVVPPQARAVCCLMRMAHNAHRRRQLQAPVAQKTMYPGDVFHIRTPGGCLASFDAFYAVNSEQLLQLFPLMPNENENDARQEAKVQLVHKSAFSTGESRTIERKEGALDRNIGVTLALRMVDRTYPFGSPRCNSRHLADYLTYGETHGSLWTCGYWKMSQSCPLFTPLNDQTDTNAPDFKLRDGRGKEYDVGPPLREIPVPPRSSLRTVASRIVERGRATAASCCG